MNHIYKTIWNNAKNAFDVVAENVSGKGKGTSGSKEHSNSAIAKVTGFFAVLTPLAAMLFVQSSLANVDVASGNTRVFNANNGVQVIDIATANTAGVSHNRYVNYNVAKTGQVLNNAVQTPKNLSIMTQLAGNIQTNKNLDKSARVILNEVTGTNRSQLSGHIEIAGNKADLVIANPYGITCSGCGFINTDKATLTTGTPQFATDGSISSYKIRQGNITIDGNGLNASGQKLLQLLSRNVNLNAQVNSDQLEVVTGANEYNAVSGKATKIEGSGSTPTYAIDSTALGGIYANRISLISSDQGVGVKMLGNVAANAQDFTLTAAGKIELKNKISSKEKLSIQNTNTSVQQLDVTGSLTAKNIEIGSVANNKLNLNVDNGSVYASNNLAADVNQITAKNAVFQAEAINTLKSATKTDLVATKVLAGQTLNSESQSLNTSGATSLASSKDSINVITLGNTVLGNGIGVIAHKNVNITAQGNTIIGTGQLKSNSNDINIKANNITTNVTSSALNTNLNAIDTLQLQQLASASSLNKANFTAKNTTIAGKSYAKDSVVKAEQGLIIDTQGVVSSSNSTQAQANDLTVKGQLLGANVDAKANNKLQTTASAVIYADNVANINAKTTQLQGSHFAAQLNAYADEHLNISKGAKLTAEENAVLKSKRVDIAGSIEATNATLNASQDLSIVANAEITAANTAQLNAENVVVAGSVQAKNTHVNAIDSAIVSQTANIGAAQQVVIDSKSANIQGALNATNIDLNITEDLSLSNKSQLKAQNSVQANAENIITTGAIVAKNTLLNAVSDLTVGSGAKLNAIESNTLTANNIQLNGGLNAKTNSITAQEEFNSDEQANVIGIELTEVQAKNVNIDGSFISTNANFAADETLTLEAGSEVLAIEDLTLTATDIKIDNTTQAKALTAQASSDLALSETSLVIGDESLNLNGQQVALKGKLSAKDADITSTNTVNFAKDSISSVSNTLTVNGKDIDVAGTLSVENANLTASNQIVNQVTGSILANSSLDLTANHLTNNNLVFVKDTVNSYVKNIENNGHLQGQIFNFVGLGNLSNSGVLFSGQDIIMKLGKLSNTGQILSQGNSTITAGTAGVAISNSGAIAASKGVTLNSTAATSSIDNSGTIQAMDGKLTVIAKASGSAVNNNAGGMLVASDQVTVTSGNIKNNHKITANNVTLDAQGDTLINTGEIAGKNFVVLTSVNALNNSGKIHTGDNTAGMMTLKAKTLNNNVDATNVGILNTKTLNIDAGTLNNSGSVQTNTLNIYNSTTGKTAFTNNAVNGKDDNLGVFVFADMKATNLSKLTNNGTLYTSLNANNKAQSKIVADNLTTGVNGYTYINQFDQFNVNTVSNLGALHLNDGTGASVINNFTTNNGIFTLDSTNMTINSALSNTKDATINIVDGSQLSLGNKNLINSGKIYLQGRAATTNPVASSKAAILSLGTGNLTNATDAIIFSAVDGHIKANTITNSELIYGLNGNLLIDANTINNNYNAGVLSLGNLFINTIDNSVSNTLNNSGDIYSQGSLIIGNNIRKNTNVYNKSNAKSQVDINGKATGGSIISDGGIDIYANNFENNFQLIANKGNIAIDANSFKNETKYYDQSLRATSSFARPTFYNLSITNGTNAIKYYTASGAAADSSSYRVKTQQIKTESGGGNDGYALLDVEEIWLRSTETTDGVSNSIANQYLQTAQHATLQTDNGNIDIIVRGTKADNYGGKIFALGDTAVGTGNISIKMERAGSVFNNQMIDLYDDRKYKVNYMLLANRDKNEDLISLGYGYMLNSEYGTYHFNDTSGSGLNEYFKNIGVRAKDDNATIIQKDTFNETDWRRYFEHDSWGFDPINDYGSTLNGHASDVSMYLLWDENRTGNIAKLQDSLISSRTKGGAAVISAAGGIKVTVAGTVNNAGKGAGTNPLVTVAGVNTVGDSALLEIETKNTKLNASKSCTLGTACITDDPNVIGSDIQDSETIVGNTPTDIDGGDLGLETDVTTEPEKTNEDELNHEETTAPKAPEAKPKPTYTRYPTNLIPKVDLTVPDTKYGEFVAAKDPESVYLVERNPLYGENSDVLGSDYLVEQLGIDPDKLLKRLGDAGYEMNLVQRQIMQIAGTVVLYANVSATEQMKKLFNNTTAEQKALGLTYGVAPTKEQLSKLTTDIVWMVTKEVNGQKVLVPQVYLSRETIEGINVDGAVIEGKDSTIITADQFNNINGTVAGGLVYVDAKNDINNIGGRIKGDTVVLETQEGSINNITEVYHFGNASSGHTTFGPTASIESTGALILDAAKDINNVGANLKAKGDASLKAGNDINILTIQDRSASTENMKKGEQINEDTKSIGNGTRTERTVTHIGSNLDFGGNASFESGGDTLISGSDVNVKGQMYAKTGGDFKLESVQDTKETSTTSSRSGFGVGGGLYGTQTQTTNDFDGKNKASNLNVGSIVVDADNKAIIQGSNINIKDKDSVSIISGTKGVDILDGKDEKKREKETVTTTFLKVTTGPSESSSGTKTYANASSNAEAGGRSASANAQAKAGASAEASASGSASLRLMEHTVEKTVNNSEKSIGSNINSEGSLLIKSSEGTATVRGSNVDVKGALGVQAKDIKILAGQNREYSSHDVKQTSIGIYAEGSASAEAGASANAQANAQASVSGNPASANASANAGASAEAKASGTLTFGGLHETSSSESSSLTHTKSTLKSGGDMSLIAENTALFEGASVKASGNLDIRGTDIISKAVKDERTTSQSSSSHLAGYFIGASASVGAQANAHAEAEVGKSGAGAGAGVSATVDGSVEVSQGLRTVNSQSSETTQSTTHQGNDFSAGGNMTRVATNSIFDEATEVNVIGNFAQKANKITDNAVYDTTTTNKSSQTHEATISVSLGAQGSAGAKYEASVGKETSSTKEHEAKSPEVSLGVSARYDGSVSTSTESSSTAVTSKFNAGGSIYSESTGDTSLTGTQFNAGKDVVLVADKLDYKAALSTTSASSSLQTFGVGAGAEFSMTGELKSAEANANYGNGNASSASTTANVGGIQAGGNIQVITKEGASFEGTQFNAGKDTVIVGDKVDFKAAQSTFSSKSTSHDANIGGEVGFAGGKADSIGGEVGYSNKNASVSGSTSTVSNLNSGGSVTVVANTGNFEGTNIASGGDTTLVVDNLNFSAARDTYSSSSSNVGVSLEASGSKGKAATPASGNTPATEAKGGSGSGSLSVGYGQSKSESDTAVVGSISSGGKLNVVSKSATFEGTNLASGGDTNLFVDTLDFKAARSTSSSSGMNVGVDLSASGTKGTPAQTTTTTPTGPVITPPTPQKAPAGSTPIKQSAAAAATSTPATTTTAATGGSGSGSLGVNYGQSKSESDTAVVGSISSGGKLNVVSKSATFEGTNLASVGDTNLFVDTLDFKAARSTSSSSGMNVGVDLSASGTKGTPTPAATPTTKAPVITPPTPQAAPAGSTPIKKSATPTTTNTPAASATPADPAKTGSGSGSGSVSFGMENAKSNQASVGSISSSGGAVNIVTKDATFEGTQFASMGDTNISGKNVTFTAAQSTSSGTGFGINLGATVDVPSKNVPTQSPTTAPAPVTKQPVITPPTPQAPPAGATPIKPSTNVSSNTTPTPAQPAAATTPATKQPSTAINGSIGGKIDVSRDTNYQGSSFNTGGNLNINADNINAQNLDVSKVVGEQNYSTVVNAETLKGSSSGVSLSGSIKGGTDTLNMINKAKDKITGTPAQPTTTAPNPATTPTSLVTTTVEVDGDKTTTTNSVNTLDVFKKLVSSPAPVATHVTPTPVISGPIIQPAPSGATPINSANPVARLPVPPKPTTPLRSNTP